MKFPLSWLRDHLDTGASLDRLTDTLSSIGLEVEGVVDRVAALAPFRTARIVEAVPHPDADRLQVCRVDAGTGEEVTVVCGAANARTGLHAVFAPPGAFIPGSGITLKVGRIRGVASAGMLVSAREMGLGEDHEGIVELPDGTPAGLPYAAWAGLDDPVIEIGVTPNRGDALAVRGVARDLAAAGLGTLKPWSPATVPAAFETPLVWAVAWPQACPWVLGRSLRGVTNRPSPDWLQRRLTAIGLRPISALVDITNFFAIDLGRPLHVFDADRLAGRTLTLRRGAGETFRALNGRDLTADGGDLVIADEGRVVSLAGIMGGLDSGTHEGTSHVFVECALFDPVTVARSGRRHQIASDARQRFERGVDPALPPAALEAATRMILDLCGGEAGTVVSAGGEPAWRRQAGLRFERLAGLGGADVPSGEATSILERLGFAVSPHGPGITAEVPSWRNDIAGAPGLDQAATLDPGRAGNAAEGAAGIEPECDLIEEVLRIRGLDSIQPVSLPRASAVPAPTLSLAQSRTALARRLLAARGFAECVTYSFGARALMQQFGDAPDSLALRNPIAADLDQMRPTPLATLAPLAARNIARGASEASVFEIGPGYSEGGQSLVAAALRAGTPQRHWRAPTGQADAAGAKADLWAVLAALGVPLDALSLTPDAPGHFHPGQSATVRQGPRLVLGRFGALHPALLARLDLPAQACGFELFLDAVVANQKRRRKGPPDLPALQPVSRDFAFLVAHDVPAETVLKAARSADRALISRVGLFDVYVGEKIVEGHKSLGVEVTFQPRDHTLTEAEIDAASERVVQSVSKTTGGHLR